MQGYYLGSFSRAEKQISAEREKAESEGTTKERRGKLSLQVTQRNSGTRLKISGVKQLINRNAKDEDAQPPGVLGGQHLQLQLALEENGCSATGLDTGQKKKPHPCPTFPSTLRQRQIHFFADAAENKSAPLQPLHSC